jgi:DNA-binding CsgD family transcriptional regulator
MPSITGKRVPVQPYLLPPEPFTADPPQSPRLGSPAPAPRPPIRVHIAVPDVGLNRRLCAAAALRAEIALVSTHPSAESVDADVRVISICLDDGTRGDASSIDPNGWGPEKPRLIAAGCSLTPEALISALLVGAWAFVPAEQPELLARAIIRVMRDERPILEDAAGHPAVAAIVVGRFREAELAARRPPPAPSPLSERETAILAGIARGASSAAIALQLGLQEQTVKNHVTAILHKTSSRNRAQAAALALQQGWLV